MMRYLLISGIVLLLLPSCTPKFTKGFSPRPTTQNMVVNPYFMDADTDHVFKAKIDAYGNYFGGILAIKKLEAASHRVVFTTEFGGKIFDFLFEGDTFTKNYVLEDLDKKFIVNTLRKDFEMILFEEAPVNQQFNDVGYEIYQFPKGGRFNYLFFHSETKTLDKIIQASRSAQKVEVLFTENEDGVGNISIKHHNIKLTIDLVNLKKK